MKFKIIFLILLVSFCCIGFTFASSNQTSRTYEFTINYNQPSITLNTSNNAVVNLKRINQKTNLPFSHTEVGAPSLPLDYLRLYLQDHEMISNVSIINQKITELSIQNELQYNLPMLRSDQDPSQIKATRNEKIYTTNAIYPTSNLLESITQYYYGYKIAAVPFFPVQYNPVTRKLFATNQITFKVEITNTATTDHHSTKKIESLNEIKAMVDNPETLSAANPMIYRNPNLAGDYTLTGSYEQFEYLIITPRLFVSACERLRSLRASQGFSSTIATIEYIFATQTGTDPQEKIRNYLSNCYKNNGTKFVLLAGDTNLIPTRCLILHPNTDIKKQIDSTKTAYTGAPSDIYYACLDGTFNYDNDDLWGEIADGENGGLIDGTIELIIGRICAGTPWELNNHINKIMKFELQPNLKDTLLIAGNETRHSEGLDNKEKYYLQPNNYPVKKLYDKDGNFNATQVTTEINTNKYGLVLNHQHANPGCGIGIDKSNIPTLANPTPSPTPFINNSNTFAAISSGCSSNSFKYDCFLEYITVKSENGAYAYIGHSSSGYSSTNEADSLFGQIIAYAFENLNGNNIRRNKCIGQLIHKAKNKIYQAYLNDFTDYSPNRQMHYNFQLQGDPLSPLLKYDFTDLPTDNNILINITHSTNIQIDSPQEETVFANGNSIKIDVSNHSSTVPIDSAIIYYQIAGNDTFTYLASLSMPYGSKSYFWTNPPVGDYIIKVDGYNGTTKQGEDTCFIRVANQVNPVVYDFQFCNPLPEYRVGQPIFMCAKAFDSDGWIEKIYYKYNYYNGQDEETTDTVTVDPYYNDYRVRLIEGSTHHKLKVDAIAIDNHDFSSIPVSKSIEFDVVEHKPPVPKILYPYNGSKLNLYTTPKIKVSATDPGNWKDEDGEIWEINLEIKSLIDNQTTTVNILDEYRKNTPKSSQSKNNIVYEYPFTPTKSGAYESKLTIKDNDEIVKETTSTFYVRNLIQMINPPTVIDKTGKYPIKLQYTNDGLQDYDLVLNLFKQSSEWIWLGDAKTTITKGNSSGQVELILNAKPDGLEYGYKYIIKAEIRPKGAPWDEPSVGEEIKYDISLKDEGTPVSDDISWLSVPKEINAADQRYSIKLNYVASNEGTREIQVHLFDKNWNWLGKGLVTVAAGTSGIIEVIVNASPTPGTDYIWKAELRRPGDPIDKNLKEMVQYGVTVK